MAAEAALINAPIGGTVEREAAMLKLIDSINGLAGQNLRRGLVNEVIAALDGVVHVPLPVVFFLIAERGSDAALCRASVRARRIDFTEDRDARVWQLHCRHQTSPTGADDDHIKFIVHNLFLCSFSRRTNAAGT